MNHRVLALSFTALMLASSMPASSAHHIDPAVPDVPVLPRIYPKQSCIPVGLDAAILARVNQLQAGDPAFYQSDVGVPSLCVNGGPVDVYQNTILQADALLGYVRNVSAEVQRQVNWRLENALPESEYPNDLVEPRTILLNDSFDGYRVGGFGDWSVVTEKGEDPLWSIERLVDTNGTRYAYRFGDNEGYEQGAHQWLVSPELDLTALKGNRTAVRDLALLRQGAREFLRGYCERDSIFDVVSTPQLDVGPLVCHPDGNIVDSFLGISGQTAPFAAIIRAYEMAIDDTIYTLPVMQHGAYVEVTYKVNLAPGEDGVRLWVYTGDRAPDRRALFNDSLDDGDYRTCSYEAGGALSAAGPGPASTVRGVTTSNQESPTYELVCSPAYAGGVPVRAGQMHAVQPETNTSYTPTQAFGQAPMSSSYNDAFTGNVEKWVTARVNLTDWLEQRVWLLFEVQTKDNKRGEDIFSDTSRFTRQKDYGFQLGRVYVEGDGYLRNFRVKETAATFVHQIDANGFGDANTTRTTTPPGNSPIVTWVHNAGDYTENGTLKLTLRAKSNATSASYGTLGTVSVNLTLRPDEVRSVVTPWSAVLTNAHPTLKENWLYEVTATLSEAGSNQTSVPAQIDSVGQGTPPILDPNVTRVQPPNAASIEALRAGQLVDQTLVRATTLRNVTLVRADREVGNPMQLCRTFDERRAEPCDEHYAGPKGEPRIVVVGVRNDGNAPQNISLDLTATLDGIGKPDIVQDGIRKIARDVLPGEIRAVTWTVIATQPGAYQLTITPIPEVPAGVSLPHVESAERKLYVQRATGLICLDTLEERECGPKFVGELAPKLRGENVTAAATGADGTLYVATQVREANDGVHSGLLAARGTDGSWRILANLSATVLNETLLAPPRVGYAYGPIHAIVPAPDGMVYLVGDNDTLLRYSPTTTLVARLDANTTMHTHLRAGIWYKDTLVVAGANGVLARLANGSLERIAVSNTSYETSNNANVAVPRPYDGNFTALIATELGAFASGEHAMFRHTGASLTAGWSEARATGNRLLSDAVANQTALTLGFHDGRLILGFDESSLRLPPLWSSKKGAASDFEPMVAPAPVPEFARRVVRGIASQDGQLMVLQGDEVVVCGSDCFTGTPTWSFLLPQRPSTSSREVASHPAKPSILLDAGASAILLGEAGMVLDLLERGAYDNGLDWSVIPELAPHDGGVIQTRRPTGAAEANSNGAGSGNAPHYQAILLVPTDANLALAQSADRYRIFVNHSLNWTNDGAAVNIRLVHRDYPAIRYTVTDTTPVYTCGWRVTDTVDAGNTSETPCENPNVRTAVAQIDQPTSASAGWTYLTKELDVPTGGNPLGSSDPVGLSFYAVEIETTKGARWAMDDLRLQGRIGGKWQDIVSWHGPSVRNGDLFIEDIYNGLSHRFGEPENVDLPPTILGTTIPEDSRTELLNLIGTQATEFAWEIFPGAPFDLTLQSPWHISNGWADRPVFAANNEQYKERFSEPRGPKLLSNWDARLVSPVIDLSDAYDPVITWRQAYSFRTMVVRGDNPTSTKPDKVMPGDGGFVEIQYTMRGKECGSTITDPDFVCWSRYFPVEPDGGYPQRKDVGLADLYGDAAKYYGFPGDPGDPPQASAHPPVQKRIGENLSYWGSSVTPDETGTISATQRTDDYADASITLREGKALCTSTELKEAHKRHDSRVDCIEHNLTGRQIRVAFHLMTAGLWSHEYYTDQYGDGTPYATGTFEGENIYNESRQSSCTPTSGCSQRTFPGEGWYITDFRVLGAAELGIDLAAKNITFNVGYDVANIGVGPGTRVPINVTIENNGAFEALGYTGRLEVRRVDETLEAGSEVVDTILLSQQPVLDAKKSRNHTIFWNVPNVEGEEYALTFTVTPIGIDRDEDHLDNVARLYTVIDPVPAKTMRRFNVEFLVSPEEATADITRYIPMFINNTGNVPIDSITIERRITKLGANVVDDAATCGEWQSLLASGSQTAIVDCREWDTQRPAPAGRLTPLTILSDEVNPSTDLFWKAPERASYLVSLAGETTSGSLVTSTAERRVNAFATYLFDDVEGGPRGEARSGNWTFGPGWGGSQPGFRSTDAYAFGDTQLDRFPADANSPLVTPTIDLGSARTAELAFYTNFAFEPGFDGAIVEASDDGGVSWKTLEPTPDGLVSVGYNHTQGLEVQASSALHPTGNPEDKAYAFTSDSALLPSNIDGWVLARTDLTDYTNITEADVEYEAYHAAEMSRYPKPPVAVPTNGTNIYFDPSWCVGSSDDRCWAVQNLTQAIASPVPAEGDEPNTFWWSGSATMDDDGVRPLQNHLLEFEVDLSAVSQDQTVMADWWEHSTRFLGRAIYLDTSNPNVDDTLSPSVVYSAFTYNASGGGADYRFNLGEPRVVEKVGHWYHMRSDMTPIVARLPASNKVLKVGFAYTPILDYAKNISCSATASTTCAFDPAEPGGGNVGYISNITVEADRTKDSTYAANDAGFAIDGFKIEKFTVTRGTAGPKELVIDESEAWRKASTKSGGGIYDCGIGGWDDTPVGTTYLWQTQSNYIGCADRNLEIIRRAPLATTPGRNWALVTALPGVKSTWRTVSVTDFSGHSSTNLLPTGDVPYAWYTGDIGCRDGAGVYCPRPNSEARLITPTFDLARIAGDNAELSFWHRFAFHQRNVSKTPLASGGVVEISVFDAQTGKWSDWDQIYSSSDFRTSVHCPTSAACVNTTPARGGRGGYTGYTANLSDTTEGPRRYDAPFKNVIPTDRDTPVQFLYTGNSSAIEKALPSPEGYAVPDGWLHEAFDVSPYIGKKVRFGFHYVQNGASVSSQEVFALDAPDNLGVLTGDAAKRRTGWWISDIGITGDVLVGKPVQLRVRAATDGNVHDGHMLLDDIGVFGARYRNNVGLFVDQTPDRYGAYPLTTTTIPVTVRNLGDTVRRNLAVEVRVTGQGVTVSGMGPEGNVTVDGALVLKGFTLGPGQSKTVNVKVHTPKDFAADLTKATLVFQLREANPNSQLRPFGAIVDNEVQGLLTRIIDFRLQKDGEFARGNARIAQVSPKLREPVDFVLAGQNTGHGPITLTPTCTATTVTEYVDLDHATSPVEQPVVAATYPCEITGDTQLDGKEWTNLTFRATPTTAGFLTFAVKVNLKDPMGNEDNVTIPNTGVQVAAPLVSYRETFDKVESVRDNFTGNDFGAGVEWAYTRGHLKAGSLVVGINETQVLGSLPTSYDAYCNAAACTATTPPIDLHNYSATTPAFLSFYHMDRLARHDGAQVRVQVLLDELRPTSENSWSDACVLRPLGGYEGVVRQGPSVTVDGAAGTAGTTTSSDPNPAFNTPPYTSLGTPNGIEETASRDFFVSPGAWEESWSLAVFQLPETCKSVIDGKKVVDLISDHGRTVRFSFVVFAGPPGAMLTRGLGHGLLVDEISVGPLALEMRPLVGQRASMLDNTTKGFNVLLENLGTVPDVVTLEFDAQNSSAPTDSVTVPSESFVIQPGESRTATVRVKLPRDPSLLPTEFTARIVAHSILDPNAAGATRLDLTFAPRSWAELAVNVEAPKGIVQEATETFIPITVENSGITDSVESKLRIVDEWAGGRVVQELDLPSMPSYAQSVDEAVRVLEFRWRPERGSIGPHTLTFIADPDERGEEYTRINNVVTLVVPVSDLLIPDLYVSNFSALRIRNSLGASVTPGFDADVARYEVTAGEVVSFDLKVANKGRAGATNVEVRAFIGALSLPPKTIPYVAPGTEAVVTFNWLAQKGEHEIEFIVRNEQVELSAANNRYPGTGVTILTVKGYEVAVELGAISQILSPASEIMVPFSITNNGNAGEDLELVAKTPAGMRLMLPREGFFLRAGETYTDSARLILAAEAVAGQQFISIDAIARENPMKVASGRTAVGVLASYGGSIAGGFAAGAPPELVIPVELVNEGNSLEPWKVYLDLPAGWTSKEPQPAKVVVPAHDRATFPFHVSVPAGTAPGDRVIVTKAVMANGEKREGVAHVNVLPLRAASVVVDDDAPTAVKGELAIPIRVQNTGNVREPFQVLLVDPPAGLEIRVEPAEFLLPPGGEAVATLLVRPNGTIESGTYAIAGFTHFDGVVPQTREGMANVQTLRVPIVRQDLRVTALEFSPRAELDAGDRVTVRASVQNFGQHDVENVPIHLFVDDVFAGEVVAPRIAAGARIDVTFNWTALDGVHTLTAVADPYEDTVDAGREDNAVSALATVGVDAANGGVAAGRADAPMGGAWIVLAALVMAVLVTRNFGSWRRERR